MIPLHVQIVAKLIPVNTYPDNTNESKGELEKMTFANSHKYPFNYQVVGSKDGYSYIWRHVLHDYWKVVSKVKEGPFSCQ